MKQKKHSRIILFLFTSMSTFCVLCIVIFTFLSVFMNKQSISTVRTIGQSYMENISDQIKKHFKTVIDLRLSRLETIKEATPPESFTREQLKRLEEDARVYGFKYMAFMSADGEIEKIFGDDLELDDKTSFVKALNDDQNRITVGSDINNNKDIVMGISTAYPMLSGKESTALIAGISVDYLSNYLELDDVNKVNKNNAEDVYCFIIKEDGSYVVRSNDGYEDNYFSRVLSLYEDVEGHTPEEYIKNLQSAMENKQDYSSEFIIYGEHRRMYLTKLDYSDWYLISLMPFGVMGNTLDRLSNLWFYMSLSACVIILIVLLIIFIKYLRLSQQQIRQLEITQAEAEKASKAKSEFLSNMSHDMRTPMNAIVGMTAIAKSNIDNRAELSNCLHKIALSSNHLLGLINDILDMSKIESGHLTLNTEETSLRIIMDNVNSIVQALVEEKNQKYQLEVYNIISEDIYCDSLRLRQVMLNILSNAVKFTPSEGSIHFSMYEEPSSKGDEYVRLHIKVKDNGIGMSQKLKEHVFEAFVREDNLRVQKIEGTGLGMPITKHIIDAMGGTIGVESELGKGTQFHITVDVKKVEKQTYIKTLSDWNVLIADDNKRICENTANILNEAGCNAEWILDSSNIIETIDQKDKDYNVFILSWKMDNTDGIKLASHIRKVYGKDVLIFIATAYDWSEVIDKAKENGVDAFISKPLFKTTLIDSLSPYSDLSSDNKAEETDEGEFSFEGHRVLVAEDNELNWEISEALLSDLGLEVEWAENGQICVDKFNQSEKGYYDVILMDIRMPIMNGYEATKAIRDLDREDAATIPIIAVSADAFAEDIRKCLDAGMNAHIAKPFNMSVVINQLKTHIMGKEF